jgi:hypothetical protein
VRRQAEFGIAGVAKLAWDAQLRMLDAKDPSYKT